MTKRRPGRWWSRTGPGEGTDLDALSCFRMVTRDGQKQLFHSLLKNLLELTLGSGYVTLVLTCPLPRPILPSFALQTSLMWIHLLDPSGGLGLLSPDPRTASWASISGDDVGDGTMARSNGKALHHSQAKTNWTYIISRFVVLMSLNVKFFL